MLASSRQILSLVGQPVVHALCSLQSLMQQPGQQHPPCPPLSRHATTSPAQQFPSSTAPTVPLKTSHSIILAPLSQPSALLPTTSPHPPTLPQGPLTVQYPFPTDYYKDREAVVYNMQAQPQGVCTLPGDVYNVPVRVDVLHRVVRWLRAMWRQGTHKAKRRGEVSGGGRKPWPQKGTGRARHGSIRSPIWVGGGAAHGPVPRSHAHDLPLGLQLLGYKCALSAKANEGRLVVVDSLVPEPVLVDGQVSMVKTKATQKQLKDLLAHVPYETALLIDSGEDALDGGEALRRGAGNLAWASIMPWQQVTVYHLLKYHAILITRPAAMAMAARLQAPPTANPVMLRRMAWLKQQQAEYQVALEHLQEGERQ